MSVACLLNSGDLMPPLWNPEAMASLRGCLLTLLFPACPLQLSYHRVGVVLDLS